eukprot:TRINITY_DN8773_c0_g1_i1.p3 TRINITY_DN8773_c0_g1~~TRINITY_DN8773_c0_g1_i1.p3  ORF type:complete len:126 (-),score=33.24 TRINITY_DN8773_c0_g1_i1:28-405(-)
MALVLTRLTLLFVVLNLGAATKEVASRLADGLDNVHSDMSAMMADDGMDDDGDAVSAGFLQKSGDSSGSAGSDAYTADSANALSAALGPRWNGKELETDAKQKTSALLQGIRGHRGLSSFMSVMR